MQELGQGKEEASGGEWDGPGSQGLRGPRSRGGLGKPGLPEAPPIREGCTKGLR